MYINSTFSCSSETLIILSDIRLFDQGKNKFVMNVHVTCMMLLNLGLDVTSKSLAVFSYY